MKKILLAVLTLTLSAPAFCADPAAVVRAMLGTAWDGTFYVAPLGHQLTQRFPIRFVNHARLDDSGDMVYDFSKNIAKANELERAGFSLADLHIDPRCGHVPRRIEIQGANDSQNGPLLYGKVIGTGCSFDQPSQTRTITEKALTLERLSLQGAEGSRTLSIDVEAAPGLLVHYDFQEAHPKGDPLAWLDELAD